ncbi:MAG: cupin domain-containing protein, partial [Acidobacteriota bacterium]
VFAFDRSQGLSEHTTPHEALIYLVDGEAEVTIDGQARLVKRGEMIVLPANRPHAVKAISRFKMILTMLKS